MGTMQLIVNGSQTHVLEDSPEANVSQLRAQLSMLEGVDCEQLNLFCSGSPLEDEVNLAALENLTIDLTVPLLGKSEDRHPRLRLERRRRRRPAEPRGESSTT